jgi:HAD superfamily hydrolase (TIGR01509 family)
MQAVAFDAMGVLYEVWDDLRQLLVPFARARSSGLDDEEIHSAYRRAMLGDLTTAQLWRELGIVGDARELNRQYIEGYRAVSGIHTLLDDLNRRGLRLGCISNDIAEWSLARRRIHEFDRRIHHWTISSEVRIRKPEEGIYRAFLASINLPAQEVVFVDDRAANIEGAAALGYRTILVDFARLGHVQPAAHSVEELRMALAVMS